MEVKIYVFLFWAFNCIIKLNSPDSIYSLEQTEAENHNKSSQNATWFLLPLSVSGSSWGLYGCTSFRSRDQSQSASAGHEQLFPLCRFWEITWWGRWVSFWCLVCDTQFCHDVHIMTTRSLPEASCPPRFATFLWRQRRYFLWINNQTWAVIRCPAASKPTTHLLPPDCRLRSRCVSIPIVHNTLIDSNFPITIIIIITWYYVHKWNQYGHIRTHNAGDLVHYFVVKGAI